MPFLGSGFITGLKYLQKLQKTKPLLSESVILQIMRKSLTLKKVDVLNDEYSSLLVYDLGISKKTATEHFVWISKSCGSQVGEFPSPRNYQSFLDWQITSMMDPSNRSLCGVFESLTTSTIYLILIFLTLFYRRLWCYLWRKVLLPSLTKICAFIRS